MPEQVEAAADENLTQGIFCGDTHLTQSELDLQIRTAAAAFEQLQVGAGDCVALLLRNSVEFIVASHALTFLGAYAVPINWHFRAAEVAYILQDCNAGLLIAHEDLYAGIAGDIQVDCILVAPGESLARSYGVNTQQVDAQVEALHRESPEGRRLHRWSQLQRVQPLPERDAPLNPMTIIYTSGTTGKPKGVVRKPADKKHAAVTRRNREAVYGIKPGVRALVPGPLYHSAPNSFGLIAAKNADCFVILERFDPEYLLAQIELHRITTLFAVPTMFVRLLALPESVRNRYDLSSLDFVIHGAAPCSVAVKQQMIDWLGPVIYEFYGATEIGLFTLCNSSDWLRKPGTVGRALEAITIAILDDERQPLAPREHGEIFIHNPLFPDFDYHKRSGARQEIEHQGLISVGDVGYLDDEGFLYICDRKKDMVISGGVNIYPAEIESELVALTGVADCAVIGVPDDEFGEALVAFVQADTGSCPSAEQLQEQLKQRLAGYKVPRRLEFVSQLPRDDSGKIFKRKLREQFSAQMKTH